MVKIHLAELRSIVVLKLTLHSRFYFWDKESESNDDQLESFPFHMIVFYGVCVSFWVCLGPILCHGIGAMEVKVKPTAMLVYSENSFYVVVDGEPS